MQNFTATVYGLKSDPNASERALLEFNSLGISLLSDDGEGREGFFTFQGMQASLCGAEQNVWMLKAENGPLIVCIEDDSTKRALTQFVPDSARNQIQALWRKQARANYIFNLFFILPVLFLVFLFAAILYGGMAFLRRVLLP